MKKKLIISKDLSFFFHADKTTTTKFICSKIFKQCNFKNGQEHLARLLKQKIYSPLEEKYKQKLIMNHHLSILNVFKKIRYFIKCLLN